MSVEEQFVAAVNVIKNLPTDSKSATFQTSDELKLKFYAYYKQATEGPNHTSKPSFYDIVGKYKWNAWKSLGDMSKEDAMAGYVSELKTIVETMSLTEPVADFYEALGPFYEFVDKPKNGNQAANGNVDAIMAAGVNGTAKPLTNGFSGPYGDTNGLTNGSVHDDDLEEYSDTFDHPVGDENGIDGPEDDIITARGDSELQPSRFIQSGSQGRPSSLRQSANRGPSDSSSHVQGSMTTGGAGGSGGQYGTGDRRTGDVNEQLTLAVFRLQQSMDQVVNRVDSLENRLRTTGRPAKSTWWPLKELSPTTTAFLVLWPFVAHLLISAIRERRRQ
ncbi:Acyl-CoA-binding domain-containing protein 5 [Halotydeus destructor]|nr:Acyl-CoA-binding domain-containing protein 5 [Halotydeus destructor]